jgi:hypothetical protein
LTLPEDKDTVLLLAGDICVADLLREGRFPTGHREYREDVKRFFFEDCAKYKAAYYIMGNHEHYNGVFENSADILKNFLKDSGVVFLDKTSTQLPGDIALWGGTLWTDFCGQNPIYMEAARRGMNDYYVIQTGNRTLKPIDIIGEHAGSLIDLEEFLYDTPASSVVVMTHMAPSSQSRHPRYPVEDPLNWSYYSNLEEMILNNPKIKVWVHGHTHDSHDYMIGETRVICNPRGYASNQITQENRLFDINKTFEVYYRSSG